MTQINPELLKTMFVNPNDVEWEYEIDSVDGTKFRKKTLFADPVTKIEVVYSVYPKGYCKSAHHHTGAQGLYVLDGIMQADGKILHPGEFVWFPAGTVGTHGATDEGGVTFLAIGEVGAQLIYDS